MLQKDKTNKTIINDYLEGIAFEMVDKKGNIRQKENEPVTAYTKKLKELVGKEEATSLINDTITKQKIKNSKTYLDFLSSAPESEKLATEFKKLQDRRGYQIGGLLQDDNERYGMKEGGPGIEALRKEAPEVVERMGYEHGGPHSDTRTEDERQMDYLEAAYERAIETGQKEDAQNVADQIDRLQTKMIEEKAEVDDRMRKAIGGSLLADDMPVEDQPMKEPMVEEPMMEEPMVEEPMMDEPEEEMLPDDEMEDEYLDFILDEALDNEEEEYLMSQLQDNDRLSEIFDKVIDVAQEFAGSGPVEGPGSGVSDSIPARLSDGEFVFTAKAVEEIGADNLMAMMKDAEMKADDRQGLAEGGMPEEEETVVMPVEQPASQQDIRVTKTTVGAQASQQEQDDLVGEEVKKSMLRGSRNLG